MSIKILPALFPPRLAYYKHSKLFFKDKNGLEIGGSSKLFKRKGLLPVYGIASRVDNCNFGYDTTWEGAIKEGPTFHFDKRRPPGSQYITEATDLHQIPSLSYDFVLSSHTLEHVANPLLALSEWIRVLKENGLLVLVVPHKDGTFDHRRPVTSLDHLIQDFDRKISEDDKTHLDEILNLHDLALDPGSGDFEIFKNRSERNSENRCLHHHVFDTKLTVELINYIGLQILAVEVFRPHHIFVIAKKLPSGNVVQNDAFLGVNTSSSL